jgi:hypothetical protein
MMRQRMPARGAARARYGLTMQGKKAAPAAGVLYCKNALRWPFAFERNGEERKDGSHAVHVGSLENVVVLFSFYLYHHALFEPSPG